MNRQTKKTRPQTGVCACAQANGFVLVALTTFAAPDAYGTRRGLTMGTIMKFPWRGRVTYAKPPTEKRSSSAAHCCCVFARAPPCLDPPRPSRTTRGVPAAVRTSLLQPNVQLQTRHNNKQHARCKHCALTRSTRRPSQSRRSPRSRSPRRRCPRRMPSR